MRKALKTLILLLIVAALPLRGYATVAAELCAAHHGGVQAVHAVEHDDGSAHEQGQHDGDHHSMASVCGLCATCMAGATLAPNSARPIAALPGVADRIPFFGARKPGYVPDRLNRPPLAL